LQSNDNHIRITINARSSDTSRYTTSSVTSNHTERTAIRHCKGGDISYRNIHSSINVTSYHSKSDGRRLSDDKKGRRSNEVDHRYSKGIYTSHTSAGDNRSNSVRGLSIVRQLRLVRENLLSLFKKTIIPFGAVSTAFLFTSFDKAKAANIFEVEGPLTKIIGADNILNPDGPITRMALGDKTDVFEKFKGLFENLQAISDWIMKAGDWLDHLPQHIMDLSVFLLAKIYALLMLVLQTPLFLFNNSYIKDATMLFSGISILMVTLLTIYEGMKRMMRKKHTDLPTIAKRFFVAALGAGVAPFLFEKSFQLINILTASIAKIGEAGLKMNDTSGFIGIHHDPSTFDWFNTLAILGFDIMLLATVIPILLQNGRRFFDLMVLCAIAPVALGCWVFKEQKYLFDKWWFNIKKLGSTPIVYSIFICILGLFIFGTKNSMTGGGFLIKMIIIVGGLARMANPPSFVKSRVDTGDGTDESMVSTARGFKKAYDTITFKRVKSNFTTVKGMLPKKKTGGSKP
jgi:hypothetical protein